MSAGNGKHPDAWRLLKHERSRCGRLREALLEAHSSLRLQARIIRRKDRKIRELRARLRIHTGEADRGHLYADRPEDEIQEEEWRKAGVIR